MIYVLGFAFIEDSVVLIRKERPLWQKGYLNGIGGHIEPEDKSGYAAMAREFEEETGIHTSWADWRWYAQMSNYKFMVNCFTTNLSTNVIPQSLTDEKIEVVSLDNLPFVACLANVPWLVNMALDKEINVAQVLIK